MYSHKIYRYIEIKKSSNAYVVNCITQILVNNALNLPTNFKFSTHDVTVLETHVFFFDVILL